MTVAEKEILSAAETKKLVREVYVFAKGVNTMLLEVRKTVRHLRALADHLDKVWRSCKTASTSIARGCMTVAGEVATASWCCFAISDCRNSTGACVDLGARHIESTSNSSLTQEADAALKKVFGKIAEVKKQI